MSQKDAATHFGVTPRTYQDYERGLKAPGAGAVEAFVRAGINANWLLTGEGPMLLADLSTMARVNMLFAERDALAEGLKQALERSWAA